MSNSVEISGLKELIDKLQNVSDVLIEDVDAECRAGAYDINDEASQNIRDVEAIDTGELLSHQQVDDSRDREYHVFNDAFHAPFIEFGTGVQFDAHPDWVQIAAQFKGKKSASFSDFVDKLKEWMRRHGYEEKNAYPAALRIIRDGLPPRPFMQPAVEKVGPKIVDRVKQLIQDALNE